MALAPVALPPLACAADPGTLHSLHSRHLLETDGVLPVGLYRVCNRQGDRFVFTNPEPTVQILVDDMLYMILPGTLTSASVS